MAASTQITDTEVSTLIAALDFKSLSRKYLFTNRKGSRNCSKVGYTLRKQYISRVNYCKIINNCYAKFSHYF